MAASEILTALVYKPKLEMFSSNLIVCPESANASKTCTMQAAQACPVNPEALATSHLSIDQTWDA